LNADEAARLLCEAIGTIRAERRLRVETEADRDVYRTLLRVSLNELAVLTALVERQHETIGRLHDERRATQERAA
jgi:hypothetical protein